MDEVSHIMSKSSKELPVPGLFLHGSHALNDAIASHDAIYPLCHDDASKHFLGLRKPATTWSLPDHCLSLRLVKRRLVAQEAGSAVKLSMPLLLTRVALGSDRATGLPLLVFTARPSTGFWLVLVNGDIAAAEHMLTLMGRQGAIRSDFKSAFRLESEPLGQGSYAIVFPVTSLSPSFSTSGEMVAKVASPKRKGGVVMCSSFGISGDVEQEVAMLTLVQAHPGVVRFHGLFSGGAAIGGLGGEGYTMLMERCGQSLQKVVLAGGALYEARAREIASGLLSALAHVHSHRVIHRDVKPDNVLLGGDGRPVLADFGIACLATDRERNSRRCGSPGYVAPEIIRDHPYGFKVDCFSTGALLFFVLSGKKAFDGQTADEIFKKTVECSVEFSGCDFDNVSAECKDLISLLLQKKTKPRPTSANAQAHSWIVQDSVFPRDQESVAPEPAYPATPTSRTSRTRSACATMSMSFSDGDSMDLGRGHSGHEGQQRNSSGIGHPFRSFCSRILPTKAALRKMSGSSFVEPFVSDRVPQDAGTGKAASGFRGLSRFFGRYGGASRVAKSAEPVPDSSMELKARKPTAVDVHTFDSITGVSTATTWAASPNSFRSPPLSRQSSPGEDLLPAQVRESEEELKFVLEEVREAEEELNCILEEAEAVLIK